MVADGRLFWMQDAYTTTDRYPYSTPARGGVNYIRNSVKVVDRRLPRHDDVLPGRPDAIRSRRRYARDLSRPASSRSTRCRPTCAQHVRYPQRIFAIQAAMFATYHMTNPAVFYNKEDQWEIPAIDGGGERDADAARTTRS